MGSTHVVEQSEPEPQQVPHGAFEDVPRTFKRGRDIPPAVAPERLADKERREEVFEPGRNIGYESGGGESVVTGCRQRIRRVVDR